jgi:hypothetical protein
MASAGPLSVSRFDENARRRTVGGDDGQLGGDACGGAGVVAGDHDHPQPGLVRLLFLAEGDAEAAVEVLAPVLDGSAPALKLSAVQALLLDLDVLAGSSLPAPAGRRPELSEDLSERELRVLRCLPSNLSAPRDRRRAVPVDQHRQDPHAPHLRHARRPPAHRSGPARVS